MFKVLTIFGFLILMGCGNSTGEVSVGDKLGVVESKTNIGDPSAEMYEDSWLPMDVRKDMLEDLLSKVKSRELKVFDFLPGELIPMQDSVLDDIFHHIDTEYVEDEFGYLEPIEIEETLDASGIVYLKFKEELYYDKSTGGFDKRVKYVCPMEQVYDEDGTIRGYRGLFWIKLN